MRGHEIFFIVIFAVVGVALRCKPSGANAMASVAGQGNPLCHEQGMLWFTPAPKCTFT